MKVLKILAMLLLYAIRTQSQADHFLYIQTENKQPFYIRINEKLFSSSGAGYLIIPKLAEGNYSLTIGFPKNDWPVQTAAITISHKDAGYLLKNLEPSGWGLFNLQTLELTRATGLPGKENTRAQTQNDAFSTLLADVAEAPSVKLRNSKPATGYPVENDNAIGNKDMKTSETVAAPLKSDSLASWKKANGDGRLNPVKQMASVLDNEGRSLVYAIGDGDNTDTITLLIPYPKHKSVVHSAGKSNADSINVILPVESERNHINTDSSGKKDHSEILTSSGHIITNKTCNQVATENDFLKVRRAMALEKEEEGMIAAARKFFRVKCFSTAQVRNLSVLFLNEESRYKFLDAVYPYTSDQHNFKSLRSLLTDEYYARRFDAMIR